MWGLAAAQIGFCHEVSTAPSREASGARARSWLHAPRTPLLALPLLVLAWLAGLRVFFGPSDVGSARLELGDALLRRQRALLQGASAERGHAIARMRRANEEWDFMGRTFAVLALANDAIAHRDRAPGNLAAIDAAIDETLALEEEHGPFFFLLPYAEARPFVQQPARSVFVDGEIAIMLAARQLVAREPRWEARPDRARPEGVPAAPRTRRARRSTTPRTAPPQQKSRTHGPRDPRRPTHARIEPARSGFQKSPRAKTLSRPAGPKPAREADAPSAVRNPSRASA